jgi:predicted SAM-dependent methyltransferase
MNCETGIRLNLGCASRPLTGYVNIDLDTLEQIRERYPSVEIPDGLPIYQYDIFNLPFPNDSISEVRSESMLEHLSFSEEREFFLEMQRVIKPGGVLNFSVPDFEVTVKQWLEARDDWQDFYRTDPEAIANCHWFGTYSYGVENRWGYLMASIFGPQNSPGQFHKNAYTVSKIRAILSRLGFKELEISTFLWKGDRNPMIRCIAEKVSLKQTP